MRDLQSDERSIKALTEFLREVVSAPVGKTADKTIQSALRSQGALAAFADSSRGIVSMSLNHQKRMAGSVLGSYAALDSLRTEALQRIDVTNKSESKAKRATRAEVQERVAQLEGQRQLLLQDLLLLQRAYDVRCKQAHSYARSAGAAIEQRCMKEQMEVDRSLSLLKSSPVDQKVIPIRAAKR